MFKFFQIAVLMFYFSYTFQQYCGPENPKSTQDCLADSDRQNICCMATFYQTGNFSGEKKRVCISTLYNSTYFNKRSVINLSSPQIAPATYNAIFDCSTTLKLTTEQDYIDSTFFGVPYCGPGPNAISESDCFNATIPSLKNCCYVTGYYLYFRQNITYSACINTGFEFINSTIANNMFSNSNGVITCVDPTNSTLSKTISIAATSSYLVFQFITLISLLFFTLI